ncbi:MULTISPECIES: LuxR C-terminal-related transcriptional regulator [unclassified Mycolicibacterium]|nr:MULTISPECIES: LuxR C-terminal-related transcriptional regulator [unclassified Mycolicibacterium]
MERNAPNASPDELDELRAAGFHNIVRIGSGRSGTVYRCTQTALDRTVAVKLLNADLGLGRDRFLRDQQILGPLVGHPNIVPILHLAETRSGRPYLVMPYFRRRSLQSRMDGLGEPLTSREVLGIGVKIAGALSGAHGLGILHGVVKPSNVLLDDYFGPALSDFGTATLGRDPRFRLGIFAAPELHTDAIPGTAADVYGLAATIFAALRLDDGRDEITAGEGTANVAPRCSAARAVPADVLPELRSVLHDAMAEDPSRRPSVQELGNTCRQAAADLGPVIDDMAPSRNGKDAGRHSPRGRTRRTTGNLPQDPTPFIGRRRELGEVRDLLAKTRVLTLIGTGGVGKTRLAAAVAADRQRAFPDGVWYVPLDGIEENRLLVTRVADVLGQWPDTLGKERAENLASSLRGKHLLLILDNCEHLVDEVAKLVDAIVRDCPQVRILATSRTPLHTAADVTYQVQPLAMPARETPTSERDIDASDAVRLFVDRARGVLPGFELTAENRASVYELVERLDRLPLAIELAAVRLRSLTVEQITQRVTNHSTMLSWGRRSAPSRQQTMRASLQWSAELCSTGERQLWARLSIFRGSFDLDAVESVCGVDVWGDDILDLLQGLVERSIITREEHHGVVRYSMLEIVRHFGQEMLNDAGDDIASLRARHVSWYLQLIARADAEWDGARQADWLRSLPLEHENIVVALTEATISSDRLNQAAEAVFRLWRYFWWPRGWLAEGMYWIGHCARSLSEPTLRARLLLIGSMCAGTAGDMRSQGSLLREGQAVAELAGDRLALGLAEHVKGWYGRPESAIEHYRNALDIYGPDTTSWRVDALLGITVAAAVSGRVEIAESAHLETLVTLDPAERFQRSYSLVYIGEALRRSGEIGQALVAIRDALRLKDQLGDAFGIAWTIGVLAESAYDLRQYERAAFLLGAASAMWRSMSMDEQMLERQQVNESAIRDRLRAALGEGPFAEWFRRGGQHDVEAVIATALSDEAQPPAPATASGQLTARESQIAELVAHGMTNKQIASNLVIAPRTVDAHVQHVLTKLGFNSRVQIAAWVNGRTSVV